MDFKDYYKVLGVSHEAAPEAIKKAFRKLARKFHPDVSKEADAAQRMKEINEAYAVLSDPAKRAEYDSLMAEATHPTSSAPGWGEARSGVSPEMSDFFRDLFGHGGHTRAGAEIRMRGEDLHGHIEVALSDAYHGGVGEVSLRVPVMEEGGLRSHPHVLNVRIPKGVRAGQLLRMRGQGGPGLGGAQAGDLFLEVRFRRELDFRVEGTDVYQTVPVTPWEAALGANIDVATPAGKLQVTIPAGSQSGRKLRLKGKGIPAAQPGNLFLVLQVVLPVPVNDEQRAVYQSMARAMPLNPRETLETQP